MNWILRVLPVMLVVVLAALVAPVPLVVHESRAAYANLPIIVEDTASANGETLMRNGCRRIDSAASSAVSSGNWATLDCDDTGRLRANTELPDAISVTATGMAVPSSAPWVLAALGCYNGSTIDLCVGSSNIAHDGAASTANPLLIGCYANAAAPSDVSADVDATRLWCLRNGATAVQITAAGALIGGDATNGLKVDVTRIQGTVTVGSHAVTNAGTFAVQSAGSVAHDGAGSGVNPLLIGCYASAAAPIDVSADTDATRLWCLRSGALSVQPTYAGVLQSTGNGVAGSGTPRVTIASDNTAIPFNLAQANGVTILMNAGATGTGSPRVTEANDSQLSAGVGASGDAAATVGSTGSLTAKQRLMTTQLDAIQTAVQLIDDDQTGATPCALITTASTNSTNCKASAGRAMVIRAVNTTGTIAYLRMYNASSAPTCSSATGFVESIPIPQSTAGAGIVAPNGPSGQAFSTGIGFCVTGGGSSTDNSNAVASVYLNVLYK